MSTGGFKNRDWLPLDENIPANVATARVPVPVLKYALARYSSGLPQWSRLKNGVTHIRFLTETAFIRISTFKHATFALVRPGATAGRFPEHYRKSPAGTLGRFAITLYRNVTVLCVLNAMQWCRLTRRKRPEASPWHRESLPATRLRQKLLYYTTNNGARKNGRRTALCFVATSTGDRNAANPSFNVNQGATCFSLKKFDIGIKNCSEARSPRCVVLANHPIIDHCCGRQSC